MPHLSPEELLDLAEGTRPDVAEPHLAACETCRGQVAELRALLADVSQVPVPEPSPLFWDRLSARVGEAVAAEQASRRARWRTGDWVWGLASALSMAVAVWAAVVTWRAPVDRSGTAGRAAAVATPVSSALSVPLAEDPSLGLIAELAGELEWDAAVAGMAVVGSADGALGDLTDDERAELRRLLDDAMAGRGV